MDKDKQLNILKLIEVVGFDEAFSQEFVFENIDDISFQTALKNYRESKQLLADLVGYPDKIEMLERETQM